MHEKGADIHEKDDLGDTPIFEACAFNNLDVVKYLHQNGADINLKNDELHTPLYVSITNRNWDIVNYLLKSKVIFDEVTINYVKELKNNEYNGNVYDYLYKYLKEKTNIIKPILSAPNNKTKRQISNNVKAKILSFSSGYNMPVKNQMKTLVNYLRKIKGGKRPNKTRKTKSSRKYKLTRKIKR